MKKLGLWSKDISRTHHPDYPTERLKFIMWRLSVIKTYTWPQCRSIKGILLNFAEVTYRVDRRIRTGCLLGLVVGQYESAFLPENRGVPRTGRSHDASMCHPEEVALSTGGQL